MTSVSRLLFERIYLRSPVSTVLSRRCFQNSHFSERNERKAERNTNNGQKFTVAVEGNIGCGKTTLLQYFSKFHDVKVLQEPVHSWRNVEGHNLLNLMYQDAEKWSFTFQSYVQLTMAQSHLKKHEFFERVKLMERSIYSARYCFVENLYKRGKLSEPDYAVLSKWFEFLIADGNMHLDLIVYLQVSPKRVHSNIMSRGREEEKDISLEYIETLHRLHEDWLIHKRSFPVPCPVLVLNADCDVEGMEKLCREHMGEILFLNETQCLPTVSSQHS